MSTYDAKTGHETKGEKAAAGYCGFISWPRLAQVLAHDGELQKGEEFVSFTPGPRGITFAVRDAGK